MTGGMPYALEKGPYLAVIEDFVNSSDTRLRETLTRLRSGDSVPELGPLSSANLAPDGMTSAQRIAHINEDWFGKEQAPTGAWQDQPPFDPLTNDQTGFWADWYGQAESILRETLIRACEVSLGLEHDADATKPVRRWPIELFWKCPQPWYEGWVTWRAHGSGPRDGQVTVLISTPGHGHPLRNTPLREGERRSGGYRLNPVAPEGPQGMWVVSQPYHRPHPVVTTAESGMGEWSFPTLGLGFESQGKVVVVAPPEDEGGVLPNPRPF